MCGRFTLKASAKDFVAAFGCPPADDNALPLFNIAPSQDVTVVRESGTTHVRQAVRMRWGLVPSWADDLSVGNRTINARAETVSTKPTFRHSFRQKRCLIAADGFYEWRKVGKLKQPYFISLNDQQLFAFAGLWDRWERSGEPIETCTIITTDANEMLRALHDRMPVILPRENYSAWLDPANEDVEQLSSLLKPLPASQMQAWPVSTLVNAPANDLPQCTERVAELPAEEIAPKSSSKQRQLFD